jgi:nucleoside-diphosphate-sugar epimerase
MYLTRRRHTPLPKAVERVANALAESASSAVQLIWNGTLFAVGQLQPYQGLHNFVGAFYESLATNNLMPAGLEQACEVVRWTEQVAREADHAKAKFYGQYRPDNRPAVVVTGANGLLGSAFVKRLIHEDEYVRLFVRRLPPPEIADHPQIEVVLGELGDPDAVDRAIEGATAVFHIGAAMGGGWAAHEAATIEGTRNVVEACLKHDVPKVIYISSLSVIDWAGHPPNQPVTESATLEPTPQQRGSYTQAKLEAERIIRAAAQERDLPVVILRPGQIWSETSALITAAVGVRLGQWLVVIGDDSNQLPLVHVDDVVEAIVLSTQSQFSHGEVFQVVDNDLMSREELVRLYSRAREPQLRITRIPLGLACFLASGIEWLTTALGRPAPISPYRLRSAVAPLAFDCSKARDELHWEPRAHTRDALRKLLAAR